MDGVAGPPINPTSPAAASWPATAARFWAIVVVLGVVTGACGVGHGRSCCGSSSTSPTGTAAARSWTASQASVGWRHFVALVIAAVIVIVGGLVLGRPPRLGGDRGLGVAVAARGPAAAAAEHRPRRGGDRHRRARRRRWAARRRRSWPARRSRQLAVGVGQLPVWQRRLLVASGAGRRVRRRSTTCRSAGRCSRSRCCSGRSRCRSCCRRSPPR